MKKILVTIGFITITMLQTTIAQRIKEVIPFYLWHRKKANRI
jgi:hypothetical protein